MDFYSMQMYSEWPNSSDNIVFELQELFGQIEYEVPLRYSIPNRMENMFRYECLL